MKLMSFIKPYGNVYSYFNVKNDMKPYIGQTTDPRGYRGLQSQINMEIGYKECPHFYNALKKYGIESFKFKKLEFAFNQKELDDLENKYIKKYDSIKNGYNIREGGSHGKLSDETKKKISIANTGKKHSEKTKKRISEAKKGEKNPMYGKIYSDEYKKNMSKSNMGEKYTCSKYNHQHHITSKKGKEHIQYKTNDNI